MIRAARTANSERDHRIGDQVGKPVKVGKSPEVVRSYRVTGASPVRSAGGTDAVSPPHAVSPVAQAEALGIPEEEFTPRVRDAVMTLMEEVDRLRREVEATRARFEEMALAADQDMLLPVLNRRAFVRELTRFIAFAERYGTSSSLLYFDLDDFKQVNDQLGHAAGDAALHHFAEVITHHVRETDVVGRLGGDEFGVILAHINLAQAMRKGEQLCEALREALPTWEGTPVPLRFSFGAYELKAGENADTAMAQADQAMYAQKRSER